MRSENTGGGSGGARTQIDGRVVQTLTTGGACDFWYLYDANGNVGQLLRYDAAGLGEAFDKVWDLPSSPADVVRKVVGWVMPNADNTNVFGKLEKAALKSIYSSIPQCCELEFDDLRIASLSAGMLYLPPFPSIDEFTASSPPTVPNR